MNKIMLGWLDFLAKCFIVAFAIYVVVYNFFLTDIRYVAQHIGSIDAVTKYTYNQTNAIASALAAQSPQTLMVLAQQDMQQGNVEQAREKLRAASQITAAMSAQIQNQMSALNGKK